jgi:hypothetical protein
MIELACGSIPYTTTAIDKAMESIADKLRERRYWIGPGSFRGISRQETERRIRLAFKWMQEFSDTKFVEVNSERQALHKVYFGDAATMRSLHSSGLHYFALQHRPNSWINSSDIDVTRFSADRFVVESVQIHECGHAFGFRHTNGAKDLMHANVLGWYPTPAELVMFQRRLGKSKQFWPEPQKQAGKKIRELADQIQTKNKTRRHYQKLRDAEKDVEARKRLTDLIRNEITPKIQAANRELSEAYQTWWAIKREYATVPGAT